MAGKLGLRLGHHNFGLHLLSSVVAGRWLPEPAKATDWLAKIPSWDMMGNDRYSDCVFVAELNGDRVFRAHTGQPIPDYREADALALYSEAMGFDPRRPETDIGSDFETAARFRQAREATAGRSYARVRVDPGSVQVTKLLIDWFLCCYAGLALPNDAMAQFDAGKIWEVTPGKPPNPHKGHEVLIASHGDGLFGLVTWGRVQYCTEAWLLAAAAPHLGGDLQGVITESMIRANGLSPSMLHIDTLRRDAQILTG
jgi:hypothetical protein